jgi:hypothetical protein
MPPRRSASRASWRRWRLLHSSSMQMNRIGTARATATIHGAASERETVFFSANADGVLNHEHFAVRYHENSRPQEATFGAGSADNYCVAEED